MTIYSSWMILSDTIVFKFCSVSEYKHKVSAIDKHLCEFWGVKELTSLGKMPITLCYAGEITKTKIDATKRGQCRLHYTPALRKLLAEKGKHSGVILQFSKDSNGVYSVHVIQDDSYLFFNDNSYTTIETEPNTIGKEEGKPKKIYTTIYERNPRNRKEAIKIHGCRCQVCGFDFYQKYGKLGENFIEVHHVKPLHYIHEKVHINPQTDLVCLCSNCHRMIHKTRNKIIKVERLRQIIMENEASTPTPSKANR